jgi:hypothetical protein
MNEWISEPNKCIGCPIEKEQWLEFKLSHCCESDEWDIFHKSDEIGRIICHLTRRENLAKEANKPEPSIRTGEKAAGLIKYRNA